MPKPSVSVIIPAYNQAQYLGQAIQSVLDQTLQSFEVIVVNDGSTDETAEVAIQFDDPRVRVIYQDNRGLAGARNTGIRAATADFVSFLDADDWLLPRGLEVLYQALVNAPECSLAAGGFAISRDNKILSEYIPEPERLSFSHLVMSNLLPIHSFMSSRKSLTQVGMFDESLNACEDWDLWLRLSESGYQFACVDEIVGIYRFHSRQMTTNALRMRTASIQVLDKLACSPKLSAKGKELLDAASAHVYLRASARQYREGQIELAQKDLSEAARLKPSLLEADSAALADFFAGWAQDPSTKDPVSYLEVVYTNLPTEFRALERRRRSELAKVYMADAFHLNADGSAMKAGHEALQAVWLDPRWALNRGVLLLVFRYWAGRLKTAQ